MYQHLGLDLQSCLDRPPVVEELRYNKDNFQFHDFAIQHGLGPELANRADTRYSRGDYGTDDTQISSRNRNNANFDHLQSWLFFGLLQEVTGKSVDLEEFRDRPPTDPSRPTLTTKTLPSIISEWETRFKGLTSSEARTCEMLRAYRALKTARLFVKEHFSMRQCRDGSSEVSIKRNDALGLSLMVLGETLSYTASKIFADSPMIKGWYGDPRESWGRSPLLKTFFNREKWCSYTWSELCGRFQHRNIAILQAIAAHKARLTIQTFADHSGCSPRNCTSITRNPFEDRMPECVAGCQEGCGLYGPDTTKLEKIISQREIPILLYHKKGDAGSRPRVDVVSLSEHQSFYSIVSHVWAEGLCNTTTNELRECQLELIRESLEAINPSAISSPIAFWIDALAIPPLDPSLQLIAIERMRDVFLRARYTIVLTNDLLWTRLPRAHHEIPMRIASAAWMRRLWTLQEAYLSRNLYFCFGNGSHCKSLDEIEDSLAYELFLENHLTSCMREEAQRGLDLMLSHERRLRIENDRRRTRKECTAALMAAVWQAVQGRETACKEHEVLALSTLLNARRLKDKDGIRDLLEGRPVSDSENQVSAAGPDQRTVRPRRKEVSDEQLEELMTRMLKSLDEDNPGCIPAGMIFLPEPKMKAPGWGWGPLSWMTSSDPDSAKLLSFSSRETTLTDAGLEVEFPGFILHSLQDQEGRIEGQHFPVDENLQEWYFVSSVEDNKKDIAPPDPGKVDAGAHIAPDAEHRRETMAIIVQEKPILNERLALLVYLKDKNGSERKRRGLIDVIWLRRVIIRQENDSRKIEDLRENARLGHLTILAEALDTTQKWCVGGPPDAAYTPQPEPTESAAPPEQPLPPLPLPVPSPPPPSPPPPTQSGNSTVGGFTTRSGIPIAVSQSRSKLETEKSASSSTLARSNIAPVSAIRADLAPRGRARVRTGGSGTSGFASRQSGRGGIYTAHARPTATIGHQDDEGR